MDSNQVMSFALVNAMAPRGAGGTDSMQAGLLASQALPGSANAFLAVDLMNSHAQQIKKTVSEVVSVFKSRSVTLTEFELAGLPNLNRALSRLPDRGGIVQPPGPQLLGAARAAGAPATWQPPAPASGGGVAAAGGPPPAPAPGGAGAASAAPAPAPAPGGAGVVAAALPTALAPGGAGVAAAAPPTAPAPGGAGAAAASPAPAPAPGGAGAAAAAPSPAPAPGGGSSPAQTAVTGLSAEQLLSRLQDATTQAIQGALQAVEAARDAVQIYDSSRMLETMLRQSTPGVSTPNS